MVNKGGEEGLLLGTVIGELLHLKNRKTYIYLICHIKSYIVLCRCLELTPILFLFHQENGN